MVAAILASWLPFCAREAEEWAHVRGKLVQMVVQLFLFAAIVHMLRLFGEFAGTQRANHLRRRLSADETHLVLLVADHKSPLKVPEGFVGFVGRS